MDDREFDLVLIGKRIKQLREERFMTQREFAGLIGCTGVAIKSWEHAERGPTGYMVFYLARMCQVSADWILGLTDERRPICT